MSKKTTTKKGKTVKSKRKTETKKNRKQITKKSIKRSDKPQSNLFVLTDYQKDFLSRREELKMCLNSFLTKKEKALLEQNRKLKLSLEFIPRISNFLNVRNKIKTSAWNKLKRCVYQQANFLCEICGEKGTKHPVECHEVWIYNEENLTQQLKALQALCPICHRVKHINASAYIGNVEREFRHFKKINDLDEITANKIISAVRKQNQIRNCTQWELDITLLSNYGIDINLEDRSKFKKHTKFGRHRIVVSDFEDDIEIDL
ncbi:MAG TPA: hypothetical protein VNG53_00470 [Bacteroidia bacterium]|nr:hypothetical protein [Bacteroidia bacterium]